MPEAECVVLFHILVEGECEVECQRHPGDDDGERRCRSSSRAATSTPCAATVPATATPLASIFSPGGHDEPPQLSYGGGGQNVALRLRLSELRSAVQSAGRGAADDAAGAEP